MVIKRNDLPSVVFPPYGIVTMDDEAEVLKKTTRIKKD
jgi:hypothetical protein